MNYLHRKSITVTFFINDYEYYCEDRRIKSLKIRKSYVKNKNNTIIAGISNKTFSL